MHISWYLYFEKSTLIFMTTAHLDIVVVPFQCHYKRNLQKSFTEKAFTVLEGEIFY